MRLKRACGTLEWKRLPGRSVRLTEANMRKLEVGSFLLLSFAVGCGGAGGGYGSSTAALNTAPPAPVQATASPKVEDPGVDGLNPETAAPFDSQTATAIQTFLFGDKAEAYGLASARLARAGGATNERLALAEIVAVTGHTDEALSEYERL